MPKLKKLMPVGLDFFETAPLRIQNSIVAACEPEDLMETIRGDKVWTEWAAILRRVKWTSPKPHGQGSTRDVTLVAGVVIRELFFHWKDNERVCFCVTASNAPSMRSFAEDYRIEPAGPGRTRLTWTLAADNTGLFRLLNPIVRFVFGRMTGRWLRTYQRILEARAASRPSLTTVANGLPPRAEAQGPR